MWWLHSYQTGWDLTTVLDGKEGKESRCLAWLVFCVPLALISEKEKFTPTICLPGPSIIRRKSVTKCKNTTDVKQEVIISYFKICLDAMKWSEFTTLVQLCFSVPKSFRIELLWLISMSESKDMALLSKEGKESNAMSVQAFVQRLSCLKVEWNSYSFALFGGVSLIDALVQRLSIERPFARLSRSDFSVQVLINREFDSVWPFLSLFVLTTSVLSMPPRFLFFIMHRAGQKKCPLQ